MVVALLWLLSALQWQASALEATFTPNPEDSIENGGDGGPLPVSMQQRKQLLELEAAIVNSQDPSATLNHVSQQNGMSPEELVGMLDRNRKDLQESGQLEGMAQEINASMQAQGGGGGGGRRKVASMSLPRRILSLITSILLALVKTASMQLSKHPKQSTLLAMLLAGTFLAVHNAPRNGIVVSSGTYRPFSRGHTTLLQPPIDYMVNSWENRGGMSSLPEPIDVKSKSSKSKKRSTVEGIGMTRSLELDTSNAEEGEVTVETSRPKDGGFALVTTAVCEVNIIDKEGDDDDETLKCFHESIRSIFDERKFAETNNSHSLKFRSFLVETDGDEDDDIMEGAVMAMKLLGDFGRYGIQPLCISYEMDDGEEDEQMLSCVAFHTLNGGHFDGELRFCAEKANDGQSSVVISATLAIPKGGRAPPIRLGEAMVSSLTESIAQSTQIRMNQTLARRTQSKRYRARASGRATAKRHQQYEQEKAQEEMASERKRRWKRNNPDAGSYRPSGHRLRSPGGGPKF